MLKRDKAPIDGAVVMTPLVDDARISSARKTNVIPRVIIAARRRRAIHIVVRRRRYK